MKKKFKTIILSGMLAFILAVTSMVPTTVLYAAETTSTNTSFDSASVLSYNTAIVEQMSGSDTMRYYKFSSNSAFVIDIRGQISSIMDKIGVYIYDANRTQIAYYSSSWFQDFDTTGLILTGGDYYLGISYNAKVSFTATISSLEESFPETQNNSNNSLSNANSINFLQEYKGVIARNDTQDYYKFTVPADCKMTVKTTKALSNQMEIIIYDDSYGKYYTGIVNAGSPVSDKVQLAAGDYFICFKRKDIEVGSGSYNFKLSYIMNGPTVISYKNTKGKKISIKWSSIKGANGYELQYSLKKTFNAGITKKIYSSKIHNVKIGNLMKNKKYYVRIRAYVNVNGKKKNSTWSSKKGIKISN